MQLLLNSTHTVGSVPELWGRGLQSQHVGSAALTWRVCTELGQCEVNKIRFSSFHHQTWPPGTPYLCTGASGFSSTGTGVCFCSWTLSEGVTETPNTQELALGLLSHISAATCVSSAPLDTRVKGHISRSSDKILLQELQYQKLQDFRHSRKPKPFLGAFLIQACFDNLGIFGCSII